MLSSTIARSSSAQMDAERSKGGPNLPVCVLEKEEFKELCDHATFGRLDALKRQIEEIVKTRKCQVGPSTFYRDPIHQLPTPFVLAAQHGYRNIVEYFIKQFRSVLDIDHAATIVSLTTSKKVHCATALWAASTGGFLEIVKLLVNYGAKVNKPTLTQSTPLRGASFHGHVEVMDYLIANGAEINTPNCIGQSPLCIAAMRGQLQAVKFLIEKGADRHQKTINGYSVMHLSATKGRVDIVKYLLSIGLSPQFQVAKPSEKGYIPCPLYLAASTGQRKMVEELISHKDCPPACKADALLMLGSTRCEISTRGLSMGSRDMWARGLEIIEENGVQVEYLAPIENYGNRAEIRSLEELSSYSSKPNFSRYHAYFQSLLIRERVMGYGDQGLIYFLIRRGMWFCNGVKFREAELLWFRAMEMEINVCETEIKHDRYGHLEGLQRDLEKDLSQYACGIFHMVQGGYKPDFTRYIHFGFHELEILDYLKSKSQNALFIDTKTIIGIILYIFASWLHYDNEVSSQELPEEAVCSQECEALGTSFVQKYLHSVEGSTLLHYALSNFVVLEDEDTIYDKFPDLSLLLRAVLHWGADEVINVPDVNGSRPIHHAVLSANQYEGAGVHELISSLVSGGVHLDAVDSQGRTALDLCKSDVVKVVLFSSGPMPLACQAASAIIREGIPYESVGLPLHIIKLIRLHDKNSFHYSNGVL